MMQIAFHHTESLLSSEDGGRVRLIIKTPGFRLIFTGCSTSGELEDRVFADRPLLLVPDLCQGRKIGDSIKGCLTNVEHRSILYTSDYGVKTATVGAPGKILGEFGQCMNRCPGGGGGIGRTLPATHSTVRLMMREELIVRAPFAPSLKRTRRRRGPSFALQACKRRLHKPGMDANCCDLALECSGS